MLMISRLRCEQGRFGFRAAVLQLLTEDL
jgi:hypothetical protein